MIHVCVKGTHFIYFAISSLFIKWTGNSFSNNIALETVRRQYFHLTVFVLETSGRKGM